MACGPLQATVEGLQAKMAQLHSDLQERDHIIASDYMHAKAQRERIVGLECYNFVLNHQAQVSKVC